MIRKRIVRGLPLAAAVLLLSTASAGGARIEHRTHVMSLGADGTQSDGPSTRPAVSRDGGLVVFDSTARNLAPDPNGAVRDVFVRDVAGGYTELVSEGPGGAGGDGPSSHPAIGGQIIAFQSDAANLVPGDGNGMRDVFARYDRAPLGRVSVAANGGDGDGPSWAPDLSATGRYIVFVSAATNLVMGDANRHVDVFFKDLRTGSTRLVTPGANGPSFAPAISPDGRYVSFSSGAANLIEGDTNGLPDVFVADMASGRIRRVSVSSTGVQQNAAVIDPFHQVSDVSRDGRFVAFDSDATNLVARDRNKDTDVFLRDLVTGRTTRVSVDRFGFEGDNDSFNPSISAGGRFIAFQSFAERLAPGDGPREDVFVFDRLSRAPTVLSVGAKGQRRSAERVRQLLQRPTISDNGRFGSFTSTDDGLVGRDRNRAQDVFLRSTVAPRARIRRAPRLISSAERPRVRLGADDRRARRFLCTLDDVPIRCTRRFRLPRLRRGTHVLEVRAGGAGMLYSRPVERRFSVR